MRREEGGGGVDGSRIAIGWRSGGPPEEQSEQSEVIRSHRVGPEASDDISEAVNEKGGSSDGTRLHLVEQQ